MLVAAAFAGVAIGVLVDRVLLDVVMSGPSSSTPGLTKAAGGGLVASRVFAFVITWLLPSYDLGVQDALLLGAAAAGGVAAFIARKRPEDHDGVRLFAVVAAGAAALRVVLGEGPVPGLLPAFPLVVVGAVALFRQRLPDVARLLAYTFVLFSLAVLATQYSSGGSGEWGGRYFAIGLPLLVPVLVFGLREVGRHLDRRTATIAAASIAVMSVSLAALGVTTLRGLHHEVDLMVAAVDDSTMAHPAADGGAPVVVSPNGAAARFAFATVDRSRWLTVDSDDLTEFGDRLRKLGVGPITFVTRDADDLAALDAGYRVVSDVRPSGEWIVLGLAPR
jgi:hypothetical protein